MPEADQTSLGARVRAIRGLTVDHDPDTLEDAAKDFGGLCSGRAWGVVRPQTVEALESLVALARTEGLTLIPRATACGQSGQSVPVGGISVDMRAFLNLEIFPERGVVRCGSGVTWRQLLAETARYGLAPEVLPLNLDISVGGTLSAGGIGSTSHRYGMAVSSVEAVEVVTGAGEVVEASSTVRHEVFDVVLGGLGQFGFICSAVLRLRQMRPRIRTTYLLYDNLASMVADQYSLAQQSACCHLEGFASAAVQGLRVSPTAGHREPFARWFYGLQVSEEYDPESDCGPVLQVQGMNYREVTHHESDTTVDHAARYDRRFEVMRKTGLREQPHPWLECFVPYDAAVEMLPSVISDLPIALGDGHRLMPIADVQRPRLSILPADTPVVAFAVLPTGVPQSFLEPALAGLRRAHDRLLEAGGKRYLSGWLFEPGDDDWERHYGELYPTWCRHKQNLDPDGLLRSSLLPGSHPRRA